MADDNKLGNDLLDAIGNIISAIGGGVEAVGIASGNSLSVKAGSIIGKLSDVLGVAAKANDADGFTYNDAIATAGNIYGAKLGGVLGAALNKIGLGGSLFGGARLMRLSIALCIVLITAIWQQSAPYAQEVNCHENIAKMSFLEKIRQIMSVDALTPPLVEKTFETNLTGEFNDAYFKNNKTIKGCARDVILSIQNRSQSLILYMAAGTCITNKDVDADFTEFTIADGETIFSVGSHGGDTITSRIITRDDGLAKAKFLFSSTGCSGTFSIQLKQADDESGR